MFAQSTGFNPFWIIRFTPRRSHAPERSPTLVELKLRIWREEANYLYLASLAENHFIGEQVWDHLGPAPCLEYRAENDLLYVVSSGDGLALAVPKARSWAEDYVSPEGNPVAIAYRYLGCALLGLPLAGFGAYPFLLLVLWLACRTLAAGSPDPADRTRAQAALVIAAILFTAALGLSLSFWKLI